jgi:long-chain acyl-CoA synthetase
MAAVSPGRVGDQIVYASVPAMFQARMRENARRELLLGKEGGAWRAYTGQDLADTVRRWTWGLLALGVKKGDRVAIVSRTRMEWVTADLAVLHAGGVTVGIYPQLLPEDTAYQLAHSEARLVFVEDEAQLEKVRSVRERCPKLEWAVRFGPDLGVAADPFTIARGEFEARGARHEQASGGDAFEQAWTAVGSDDLATIIYTSGTTGPPKGALLSHGNLGFVVASATSAIPGRRGEDLGVVFLPMAHALQRVGGYLGIYNGVRGAFAESVEKVVDAFRELRPTVQVSVPRIWEKIHGRISAAMESAPAHRRAIFRWALAAGRASAPFRKRGRALPPLLRLRWWLARALWRSVVWPRVGLGRVRFLTSGGAPIGEELLEFFYAMDVLILEAWGLTETAAPATLNTPEAFKFGSVGRPIPGVDVRVAPDGELLVRGPGVFKGYYKDEEGTRAAFDREGFFRTGDIGEIDSEGFVRITDRKKDIIVTSGGKKIAPQTLERVLKECRYLGPCLIHGDRRQFVSAILTLDREEIVGWARERGLPGDMGRIAAHEETQRLVTQAVERANGKLAGFERVRRWAVVGDDWSEKTGELTPTLKVKRRALEERYRGLLESFYEDER